MTSYKTKDPETGAGGAPAQMRVLLVEDSEDDAALLLHALRRAGMDPILERVETPEEMLSALEDKTWDVVLSDYNLPRFSAPHAFAVLRSTGIDLPFIIVSGTVGEDAAVEAMKLGVHDFLLKGNLVRLVPAIEREVREARERRARHVTEEKLRKFEDRYRLLFESSPLPMWVFDVHTLGFLTVNEAAVRHYGYSREEFLAMTISDIRPPADVPALRGHLEDPPDIDAAGVWRHTKKDGAVILVEIKAHDFDLDGARARLVLVNDVTERKRAEEALRKSEDQLRQLQKMEAVGRLAGGVAHDFNNLLSVILTYAELLKENFEAGAPAHDDLKEIRKAAKRASDLTRQLLMFSRQQVIAPRVLDLNDVLVNVDNMLRRTIGEDVELSVVRAAVLGHVRADPGNVEQIIMNLVVNARDAMPTGGKITIETANVVLDAAYAAQHMGVKPGPHVMLAVSDTGLGMDAATRARIFEPFFTTKEVGKGTGLGLSTVLGIVAQNGGSVWVYSEPGKGSTFKVYLPRVDEEVDVSQVTAPPVTLRGTETILLVEDDEQVRAAARGILQRHGYSVLEARGADEAWEICDRHRGRIDALVSDVVMPQTSGPALAKRLTARRPAMKVLFMSGYTDDAVIRHGVLGSGVAFLQKPITPETLTTKVREVLDGRSPRS